ncbi:HAD hydrolase family protein [candidate division KSB1 bacterium]|nr:HAD hydrolase family protein [candidate division KSB1 bacterium]
MELRTSTALPPFDLLTPELRARLSRIRFLLLDVDGVLTDGRLSLSDSEIEAKTYSTRDGFAIVWIKNYGLAVGVISGRRSSGTDRRCRDLKMDEIHLGHLKKVAVYEEIAQRRGLGDDEIAFIGDDLIDLPLMKRVGVSACPADAHFEVAARVDVVLRHPGGNGAIREFIDLWLMAAGKWEQSIEDIFNGNY